MDEDLKKAALAFHEFLRPGKVQITPTKPLATQYDLSLAYSPGVAAPCLEIEKDPSLVSRYTNRSNLVAVISNGTAVLGLGDIGPLAGKPVMEGKAVLFKKFAGIDVFDIEINEKDPDKIVDIIASLEPTFGGINLEDIKAPECFYIEAKIKERLKIPVFHDDQHGTAIIAAAAILNALEIVRKKIGDIKVVCSGAGAAAVACLNLLLALGIDKKNVVVCDSQGVIYEGRNKTLPPTKQKYAIKDDGRRTLGEVMEGSDLFLGLSGPDVLEAEMVKSMARDPIIMALANPEPEIWPPLAKAVRPDAIICTGRSDFPNQVNNVLCFPFIFRGALDVGATAINEEMKIASVHAIAKLAKAEASDLVKNAVGKDIAFGPEHVIPSPFDPRLIVDIASAVAKAAMDSGVATRPLEDLESYQAALTQYVYKTNLFMRPIFAKAKKDIKRVVLCNGEEERVLQATYSVVASGICKPILVGRREVIKTRLQELRINLKIDEDFEIFNSDKDPRYDEYCETYYQLCKRRGITRQGARQRLVHAPTRVGALMLYRGEADALVCGTVGAFKEHFAILEEIIGYDNPEKIACAMNALMLSKGNVFITDTHVNEDPDALQIARITEMSARYK